MPPVVLALLREIVRSDGGPDLRDNVDPMRFHDGCEPPSSDGAAERLADLLRHGAGFGALYDLLEHPADRALLVQVLAFRVLGHRKVHLPMTLDRLRGLIERAQAARTAKRTAPVGVFDWYADDFDLTHLGYNVRLRTTVGGVVQTFEQDGRVISYEFESSNLDAFHHNLSLNPQLASRVEIVPAALWDQPGSQVAFHPYGPGTSIQADGEAHASTDTIDALVARGDVNRVDFIKLDVEGSELKALHGSEATLRRFRPRLAVAAYHRPEDLAAIPSYLFSLDLGYRFRLDHTTMHAEETILFAFSDYETAGPSKSRADDSSQT